MLKLGVNIDHVATLRQARYRSAPYPAGNPRELSGAIPEPDPVWAAVEAELAGAHGIAVGQGQVRELVRTYPEHGEIGVGIVPNQTGGKFPPVGEKHAQVGGAVNDVAVGEQVAIGGDEETRARAARRIIPANLNMDDRRMSG